MVYFTTHHSTDNTSCCWSIQEPIYGGTLDREKFTWYPKRLRWPLSIGNVLMSANVYLSIDRERASIRCFLSNTTRLVCCAHLGILRESKRIFGSLFGRCRQRGLILISYIVRMWSLAVDLARRSEALQLKLQFRRGNLQWAQRRNCRGQGSHVQRAWLYTW